MSAESPIHNIVAVLKARSQFFSVTNHPKLVNLGVDQPEATFSPKAGDTDFFGYSTIRVARGVRLTPEQRSRVDFSNVVEVSVYPFKLIKCYARNLDCPIQIKLPEGIVQLDSIRPFGLACFGTNRSKVFYLFELEPSDYLGSGESQEEIKPQDSILDRLIRRITGI